jgi:WD40 repeat protein
VADASKFVAIFSNIIAASAPHIYLSALPFAPELSKISQQFSPLFPHTLSIQTGKTANWTPIQCLLMGHTYGVRSIAFSPDSKYLLSGSKDQIFLWDVENGTAIFEDHNVGVLACMALSQDGKHFVLCFENCKIFIHDTKSDEIISGPFTIFLGFRSVAFSQDGKCIVLSMFSHSNDKIILSTLNAETGGVVFGPFEHNSYASAFSQDGKWVALAGESICIMDMETGSIIQSFEVDPDYSDIITCLKFSYDRKCLAASYDEIICIWDVLTGSLICELCDMAGGFVTSIAFSQDDKFIVSASSAKTVCIWDVKSAAIISGPFEGHTNSISSVAFSPDGKSVASCSADETIYIWIVEHKTSVYRPFKGHIDMIKSVAYSQDGKYIVFGSEDGDVYIWDAKDGAIVYGPFENRGSVESVAFLQGSKCVICVTSEEICIWHLKTGISYSGEFQGSGDGPISSAISWDGQHIIMVDNHTIHFWKKETGEIFSGSPFGHDYIVYGIAISQDGKRVVEGLEDYTIRIWDTTTVEVVTGPIEKHCDIVICLAFSHDDRQIVSGSLDTSICVWDAETGAIVSGPMFGHKDGVTTVAFSHNGQYIVSGSFDESICIWDVKTGEMVLGPFQGHTDAISSVAFSPDDKYVISGSKDEII